MIKTLTGDFAEQVEYPKAAFILYAKGIAPDRNDSYRLEMRGIRADGRMGAARPVSREFISGIAETFSVTRQMTPHGAIPERLLYADPRPGNETYLWYSKPQKRHLMFTEGAGVKDGDFMMPGTLYAVHGGSSLHVFCFEGRKPDPKKPLLTGPFFNTTYPSGSVCLGSARSENVNRTEKPSWENFLLDWERVFWNSVNVHPGGGKCVRGDLREVLESCRKAPLDLSLLIPTDKTVNKMIKNMENGKYLF